MRHYYVIQTPAVDAAVLRHRVISRRVKTSGSVAALLADLALPLDQERADRMPLVGHMRGGRS